MNQKGDNRNFFKALLVLVICLFAISADNGKQSDNDSRSNSILSSSVSAKHVEAIPVAFISLPAVNNEIEITYSKGLFADVCRAIVDSHLVRHELCALRKSIEAKGPHNILISYISLLRVNREDPPDLSQLS